MSKNKLTRQQKEAVGLLSIGTFLEYFDLMLYIHMAVLLNELFFPKTDPFTSQLLTAFTFCSTFILRPLGGYLIGRLGDYMGRKYTIILTTFVMSMCCIVMANIPTYSEIGLTASIIMIVCRMLQGFSSMGEKIGAQLYLSEILRQPSSYIYTWIVHIKSELGGLFALIIAYCTIYYSFNWRLAFWIGGIIAIIGIMARTTLRETPEFADYKQRLKNKNISVDINKVNIKIALTYFSIRLIGPACFYVSYIYLITISKELIKLDSASIILHNLKFSLLTILILFLTTCLTKKYHPIKVAKAYILLLCVNLFFIPIYVANISNIILLYYLQLLLFLPGLCMAGVEVACFKHIHISNRFATLGLMFGLSSAVSYVLTSFLLAYLTKYFGNNALLFIYIPLILIFFYATRYIKKLEIKRGTYHNYPHEKYLHKDTAINEDDYEYDDLGDEYEPFKNKCEYSTHLMNKLNEFSKEKNAKLNMKLIDKAVTFAKRWHGTQMRKTGDHPFYWHPLKVAEMVAERYTKTDVVIGAILHDTVEDSDGTTELIEEKFNKRIAEIVDRLTKKRFVNGECIVLTLEQTLDKLSKLGDNEALFIKQMDRQHNLETIKGLKPHKQEKMAEETNNYFIRLIAIIGDIFCRGYLIYLL